MSPLIKKVKSFFLFLITSSLVWDVQASTPISVARQDISKMQLRSFNKSSLDDLRLQDDFQYATELSVTQSLWDRFWLWFWQLIGETFVNETTGTAFRYAAIAMGIAVVIFVIIKLSGMDLMQILTGKPAALEVPYSETLENIHEINFDQSIQDAVNNKNYRLAVRLLYLKSLKKLSDSGFIDWQLNKTNSVYINEINHPEKKADFSILTRQFEFIWYGEFFLEASKYQQIENHFKSFMNRM